MVRLLILVTAVLLGGYRVWSLRRRRVSIAQALGVRLSRRSFVTLAVGAAIGAAAMTMVFLIEWGSGLLSVTAVRPATALVQDLSTSIMVPLIEELVFRSAILGALLLLVGRPAVAVVISALVFGGAHAANANATGLSVLSTILGGLYYGGAFAATGGIWLPFGLHFGWNYTQGRVFGFAISSGALQGPAPLLQQHDVGPALLTGGAYGPEGGLLGIGARVVVIAAVWGWLAVERRRWEKDPERFAAAPRTGVNGPA
jgi:membrane protease YdiL (CAAX protease family)